MEKLMNGDMMWEMYREEYQVTRDEKEDKFHLFKHGGKSPVALILPCNLPMFADGTCLDPVELVIDNSQTLAAFLSKKCSAAVYRYMFGHLYNRTIDGAGIYFESAMYLDTKSKNLDVFVSREWNRRQDCTDGSILQETLGSKPVKYLGSRYIDVYHGEDFFAFNTRDYAPMAEILLASQKVWYDTIVWSDKILQKFEREKDEYSKFVEQILRIAGANPANYSFGNDEVVYKLTDFSHRNFRLNWVGFSEIYRLLMRKISQSSEKAQQMQMACRNCLDSMNPFELEPELEEKFSLI